MKQRSGHIILAFLLSILLSCSVNGQSVLERNINLDVSRQRLDNVLEILSNKGNFFFSYNSNIIRGDSLVSLNVTNRPVRDVLLMLFGVGYEFKESGNYIILRRAP